MSCRAPLAVLALTAASAFPADDPPRPAAPGQVLVSLDRDLREPFAIDFDAHGRAYIAQMGGHRVSLLDPHGRPSVLAGSGEAGPPADEVPAAEARFNGPHHLLLGPDGALYVADTFNHCVRRIDLATGTVTRFAGTGAKGFGGDSGPARDAVFDGVFNIAFHRGSLYVADLGNRRVRAIDLKTGLVRTVAGNGQKGVPRDGGMAVEEPLVDPRAIALDPWGNLYICERGGHAVRVVDSSGRIRTVVGTGEKGHSGDGGPAREARLDGPKHLFAEANGDVLITDTENHVIRRYSPATATIRRVAGTGGAGANCAGPALSCELNRPHGAQVHPRTGEIHVSDSENHRVLRIGRPRLLLAVGAATGWQHESVTDALATLHELGRESGLWQTTVRTDAELLTRKKLENNAKGLDHFDALFLVSCGDLPLDDEQKQALLSFVRDEGKGLVGAHGATVASWPEYVEMIGGRFDGHPWDQLEAGVRVDDPAFPAVRHFPERFRLFDEFYQVQEFSRERSRVLLSLETEELDATRPDVRHRDVPLAWAHRYGKGRVFYSSLGHLRTSWARPDLRQMWREAVTWAMGLDSR